MKGVLEFNVTLPFREFKQGFDRDLAADAAHPHHAVGDTPNIPISSASPTGMNLAFAL
jgi:hypothetical protein